MVYVSLVKQYIVMLFRGRLDRKGYLAGTLYYTAAITGVYLFLAVCLILFFIGLKHGQKSMTLQVILIILTVLFYASLVIATLAVSARRLHDAKVTSLLCILGIIPFINIPFTIFLLVYPSQYGVDDREGLVDSLNFWEITKFRN